MQSYNLNQKAVNLVGTDNVLTQKWKYFLLLPFLLLFSGCDALKDSQLAQIYHNITAKYNGYFNAREIMEDMEVQTAENYNNDFSKVLPVYTFPNESMHKGLTPNADQVIKKCTRVIQKHKTSKWVDDCYFLIAKANFYKGAYLEAIKNFQYIHTKYQGNKRAYQSLIWLVHTHINREKIKEANAALTRLKSKDNFPSDLKKSLWLTETNVSIARKDYTTAAEKLRKAVKEENDRDQRTRYFFVLGQLYLKLGDYSSATKYFNRVRSGNAPYEMVFQSKLKLSRCYQRSASRRLDKVKNDLKEMLKDAKNLDYVDQVYYELAQIEEHQENWYDYVTYLKLTVRTSNKNQSLKAKAYHELGEHYYEGTFYKHAKNYYDSAIAILPESFPEAEQIKQKQDVLTELVNYEKTIQQQDSLQSLKNLDTNELNKRFQQIIANKKAKEEEEANREKSKQSRLQQPNQRNLNNRSQNFNQRQGRGGDWYFYNNAAKSRGLNQFQRNWGNRPLRDNWRFKTEPVRDDQGKESAGQSKDQKPAEKQQEAPDQLSRKNEQLIAQGKLPNSFNNLPEGAKDFYGQIPFTEKQLNKSNQKIQEAYYQIGVIYYKRLGSHEKAIKNFKQLNQRYNDHSYKLRTYFHLYNIYKELGDQAKAEKYKKLILSDYPDSKYATLITNPEKLRQESQQNNKALQELYSNAFQAYQNNDCQKVEEKADIADSSFNDEYLNTKLLYLELICKGRAKPQKALKEDLQAFLKAHSDHPVAEHAQTVMNHLNKDSKSKSLGKTSSKAKKSPFEYDPSADHYYLINLPLNEVDVQKTKQAFADYNNTYFKFLKLNTSQTMYDQNNQLFLVKQFDTKQQASKYWRSVHDDNKFKEKINLNDPTHFVITKNNYKKLIKENLFDEYKTFFEDRYLRQ